MAMVSELGLLLGLTRNRARSRCRADTVDMPRSSSNADMAASRHNALMSAPVYLHCQQHEANLNQLVGIYCGRLCCSTVPRGNQHCVHCCKSSRSTRLKSVVATEVSLTVTPQSWFGELS
eukprot:GHUV01030003.1.p2 GENE.GHUV01030003.1~~GHUV01030003.1.p2  ORF type:complete len:120 (+),score=11.84 GHUV01030003.1:944-1303(+)